MLMALWLCVERAIAEIICAILEGWISNVNIVKPDAKLTQKEKLFNVRTSS